MKKIFKLLGIIIIFIISLFLIFMIEESIRLKNNFGSKPLIVIGKVLCSKDDWICYGDDGKYTEEYYSLGFILKQDYYLDVDSTKDNHKYHLVKEEFLLFNKFKLWLINI